MQALEFPWLSEVPSAFTAIDVGPKMHLVQKPVWELKIKFRSK